MKEETREKIDQLYSTGNLGYAYIYPKGSSGWNECLMFELSPANIANVVYTNAFTANKVEITDMLDRLVCKSIMGGFLDQCPNQELCKDIIKVLAPLQLGEAEPQEVLNATCEEMSEYMREEDEMVTMAEISMM